MVSVNGRWERILSGPTPEYALCIDIFYDLIYTNDMAVIEKIRIKILKADFSLEFVGIVWLIYTFGHPNRD